MDETAAAIARLREEAKPDASSKPARLDSDLPKSPMNRGGGLGRRKSGPVAPASSTKRQKSGGG